ncbi:hypothetical protein NL676_008718 [Syzygium grande]|nr:hypothetical protein NL676_008718 [Syzygium grande]
MEFNAESCLPGFKPNRVYFPDYQDNNMKSYSMEDGKVETYFDATSRHIYEAQCPLPPKRRTKAKPKALCLVTDAYNNIAKFSSLSTGRIYPVRLPGSLARTLSALGWILVSEGPASTVSSIRFRASIELPALEKLHRESRLSAELDGLKRLCYGPHGIDRMALSSSPSLSRSYTVMISYTGSQWFAFHRSGEDAWTVVSPVADLIQLTVLGLIYYDGLFVALDAGGQIMTLNERESAHGIATISRA